MRSALIELSAIAQPFNRIAHWVALRAGNDQRTVLPTEVDISELKLLVRPRLGKVRRLATSAANSDRLDFLSATQSPLQLASHNAATPLARLDAQPRRPALRVVVKPDANGGTGRMVISGRMADVCAELDRLAHQHERQMQPCA
ncbi:hypothetical protein [Diaphorobacter caeni]|uniref:hypothetical protein n=1 Tax=Diaphorobacter caeni TaxID=2784387 RepID=UPI00188F66E3|nr:hypothetical protein [Diaphorobacter caeni]MBF5004541.1 hypothetical protein [Diaphorobacter caeni]